jgi:hypothetical protein
VGVAGDLAKDLFDLAVGAFLECKNRSAETAKFTGRRDKSIRAFLDGIADEDQGRYLEKLRFLLGVDEDLADLGCSGAAHDAFHQSEQFIGARGPAGCPAFAEATVVEQLNVETADIADFAKHVGLQSTSGIPCWLPACRAVEGENQPPGSHRADLPDISEISIDISGSGDSIGRILRLDCLVVGHGRIS